MRKYVVLLIWLVIIAMLGSWFWRIAPINTTNILILVVLVVFGIIGGMIEVVDQPKTTRSVTYNHSNKN